MKRYMDQNVVIQEFDTLRKIVRDDLSHSTVLLWLGDSTWNTESLNEMIREMARTKPLYITVAGERVDESFDILLLVLGHLFQEEREKEHIMTGIIEETDPNSILDEFLDFIKPSIERFDDWQEYRIMLVGDADFRKHICEIIEQR